MGKIGKRYKELSSNVQSNKRYLLDDAIEAVQKGKKCKFDESIDVAVRLGIDPKQADQAVRGVTKLPHGTGKTMRVAVLAKGDKAKEASEAGADVVGDDDLLKKIKEGWLEFDSLVATPDMMSHVGKIGSILGPRGLMPNPKSGTVTMDVAKAIADIKAGKIEFRAEKAGIIHVIAGKASFSAAHLKENLISIIESLQKAKPSSSKGTYLKSVTISTTMGPGISVDPSSFELR
ncbi:MAG: 50S ribosomal protein L1 [Bdellovibrionales bacterium]|nr:50S ribosomal protein L1 [Bdellovibrionales bacterium]